MLQRFVTRAEFRLETMSIGLSGAAGSTWSILAALASEWGAVLPHNKWNVCTEQEVFVRWCCMQ